MEIHTDDSRRYLSFVATEDYLDGDTWTVNGSPVTVTYAGGEPLLPTAVLEGDTVMGVLDGTTLRLMLDKPTPQPNMLINGDFTDPINQRGKSVYAERGYTIDGWTNGMGSTFPEVEILENGIHLKASTPGSSGFTQVNPPIQKKKKYCAAVEVSKITDGRHTIDIYSTQQALLIKEEIFEGVNIFGFELSDDWDLENSNLWFSVSCGVSETNKQDLVVSRIKLEEGKRFTGWDTKSKEFRLAECQNRQLSPFYNTLPNNQGYVFQGICTGWIRNVYGIMPTPVTFAYKPTITADLFKLFLFGNGKASIPLDALDVYSVMSHGIIVRATASIDLVYGETYMLYTTEPKNTRLIIEANTY